MTSYRAAFFRDTVLTRPEHAALSDEQLRAEALAEAQRADIIDMEEADPESAYPHLTRAQFESGLQIGDWVA
jgi:hypothetical protein